MSVVDPQTDERWMSRAIRLAMNGRGRVEPNPMVACVIVKNGRVIGEGYHQHFGGPHAEPNALARCTESSEGATAYVTLEPCCHTNKKTPPCGPRLIEAKIGRVFVGCLDPNPEVNGKGIAMLREAGIRVDGPLLEPAANQLIAPFLAHVRHARPYVTLKWAESRNGKVAGRLGRRVKITNEVSDALVHALRGRCDAIAVGTNTVLNDDPLLTARHADASPRQPIRVVLSNTLKLPLDSRLVRSAHDVPVKVFCSTSAVRANLEAADRLRAAGVDVVDLRDQDGHFSFTDVLGQLHALGVTHLLVEPGPTLTRSLFARGQADRVWVFRSAADIDSEGGLAISSAPIVGSPRIGEIDVAGDTLTEYLNPASPVFFAPEPSADFVLAKESLIDPQN